jgi:hypothetical protein
MRALFETIPRRPGQDLLLLYRTLLGDRAGPFTPWLFQHHVPNLRDRDHWPVD